MFSKSTKNKFAQTKWDVLILKSFRPKQVDKAVKTQEVTETEINWENMTEEKGQQKRTDFMETEVDDWRCL